MMKKMILMAVVLLSITVMGSCTNKEGDTEFETLTPGKDKDNQSEATLNDTIQLYPPPPQ